ncbi:MAG TPA: class I SAM-dependent methyltransferase, partial [Haliangium sp.]|nr:class I SAM-dependent methyltransferase [Haliangium sp.]
MAAPPPPADADLGDEDPADAYPADAGLEDEPEDEHADGESGEPKDDIADDMADLGPADETELPPAPGQGQALRPAAIDAVPVYQEDRPPVHARAITSELLTVSAVEAGVTAPAASEVAPPEGARLDAHIPKTVKMTALPFEDVGSMSRSAEDDDDSVDIPLEEDEPAPTSQPVQRRSPRASTMALSDDDLEEFLEPADDADGDDGDDADDALAALAAMMGTSKPSFSAAAFPAFTLTPSAEQPASDEDSEGEAAEPEAAHALARGPAAEEEAPVEDAAPDAEEAPEPEDEADAVAVAEDELERPDSEAPAAPADTSDSGEILEDDMIEEVDEPKAAARQDALAPPAPPPAPPKAAPPAKVAPKSPPPAPKSADSTPIKKSSRKGKSWFEEIFDEDYLRTLPFLTPQATQAEALFVAEALGVEPGARLLDVGCGYGRHAMELAARGYQIVALDLSLPLLLRGADEAQRRGLNINFIHGDMRDLVFESQFDGIYCLFSTFGYFDEDTNRKTIEGMARALKRGGRLVLDVLNRDYLIGELPTRVWWEGDGCVVLEEVDFNYFSSRIHSNRSIVFDDGRQLEQEISIRSYSLHELGKMLHSAGLRVIE